MRDSRWKTVVTVLAATVLGGLFAAAGTGSAIERHAPPGSTAPAPGEAEGGSARAINLGPTGFFAPPVVRGDENLLGNAVDFHAVVTLEVADRHEVWAVVRLEGRERGGDGTIVRGNRAFLVYRSNEPIHEIAGARRWEGWFRDRDPKIDAIRGDGFVPMWACLRGAEGGAGSTCGCEFFLGSIEVR